MIATIFRSAIRPPLVFLNQPIIKEGIKNVASCAAFVFGLYEIYDDVVHITEELRGRATPPTEGKKEFSWMKTAGKVLLVVSKISLLLSCFTSRPGLIICGWIAGKLFTPPQLQSLFGSNTIFAVNPYHPRHLANLAAFILGLPALVKSIYDFSMWLKHTVTCALANAEAAPETNRRAYIVQIMATINTLFSRTMLHLVNGAFLRFRTA